MDTARQLHAVHTRVHVVLTVWAGPGALQGSARPVSMSGADRPLPDQDEPSSDDVGQQGGRLPQPR